MNLINVAQAGVITSAPSISKVGMNVLFFLLSVAGIIAIISLVLAGTMYLIFAGDEKKIRTAKTAVTYSIMGIVLAMGGLIVIKLVGQFFSAN